DSNGSTDCAREKHSSGDKSSCSGRTIHFSFVARPRIAVDLIFSERARKASAYPNLVGMPAKSFLTSANNASASKTSLSTQLSTYFRLRVAIQVSTAIKGHLSSSVENSVGAIAETREHPKGAKSSKPIPRQRPCSLRRHDPPELSTHREPRRVTAEAWCGASRGCVAPALSTIAPPPVKPGDTRKRKVRFGLSSGRLGIRSGQLKHFRGQFGLAMPGPGAHELPPLVENVRPPVGTFNLCSDLMAHRLLDHSMGECRDLQIG